MTIEKKIFKKGKYLFRANKTNSNYGTIASINYKNAPVKYFTLNKSEVSAYTKYGTTYTKTWKLLGDLNLVKILNYETRKELENKFSNNEKEALNSAFPIINGIVSRNSTSTKIDNIVLKKICDLGYDGYYMKTVKAFHSEVGLCPSGFSKLQMINSNKLTMPNKMNKTRKRKRENYQENNQQNNQINSNFKPSALFK